MSSPKRPPHHLSDANGTGFNTIALRLYIITNWRIKVKKINENITRII